MFRNALSNRKRTLSRKLALVTLMGGASVLCLGQGAAPVLGGSSTLTGVSTNNGNRVTRGTGSASVASVPEDFASLKLASGFLLSLTVYDMPEISGELRVDGSGNVAVPLSGPVHVAGMTLPEAKAEIQKKLVEAKILKSPQLNLDVLQYAAENVTVLGEVQAPGRVQLLAPHNLTDVLGMVGGETQLAGNSIEIRRVVDGTPQTQKIQYSRGSSPDSIKGIMVYPGDIISVGRAGIVYVMGAVNRPGGYVMQENGNLNVTQALTLAYGTAMNASIGSIRVIRKDPEGKLTEIPVPYGDITKGKATPLTLQAEDMVYVPVSKIKTALTSGMGIMSSTASALIYTTR